MNEHPVVEVGDVGKGSPPERIEAAKADAYEVVVGGMKAAAERGDLDTFNHFAHLIFGGGQEFDATGAETVRHLRRLDTWRLRLTLALVISLAVMITAVVVLSASGSTSASDAAPYISIFSGLVGIAIGWLFGSLRTSDVQQNERGSQTKPLEIKAETRDPKQPL